MAQTSRCPLHVGGPYKSTNYTETHEVKQVSNPRIRPCQDVSAAPAAGRPRGFVRRSPAGSRAARCRATDPWRVRFLSSNVKQLPTSQGRISYYVFVCTRVRSLNGLWIKKSRVVEHPVVAPALQCNLYIFFVAIWQYVNHRPDRPEETMSVHVWCFSSTKSSSCLQSRHNVG